MWNKERVAVERGEEVEDQTPVDPLPPSLAIVTSTRDH